MTQHDEQVAAPDADTAPPADAAPPADEDAGGASPGGGKKRSGGSRLEEEGEIAADYLEELLDIADLDGDIDIDVENGRAVVSILADAVATRRLRRLVGADGQVLEALQELTRLAVQTRTGDRSRMMLDVAGFRAERRRELESVATRAVREVQRTGEAVSLDPMTPFERKVVHDVVAAEGLLSESDGEEPHRRVVVRPGA
jgi:spoIIIJ-associated protein